MKNKNLYQTIIEVGKMAFIKGLSSGLSGNISCRTPDGNFLITAHKTCLGFLTEEDILEVDSLGTIIGGKSDTQRISTESKMHLALYSNFDYNAVIHLHLPLVNSLVCSGLGFEHVTYESALTLGGTLDILPQKSPTVVDIEPLIEAFNKRSIAILQNHGIVAAGDTLIEAFSLADVLEETAKITINKNLLTGKKHNGDNVDTYRKGNNLNTPLPVFSDEHMVRLQKLINEDPEAQKLGKESNLTVKYAIKMLEDGKVFNMHFVEGRLAQITNDEDADFVNVGKKDIWIHVFNGRIDPFAATSQKKLRLTKGYIGDLSKWYAPFYRIFDLWKQAPVLELTVDCR